MGIRFVRSALITSGSLHCKAYNIDIAPDKSGYSHNSFLITPQKHTLWIIYSVGFSGEIRKLSVLLIGKSTLSGAIKVEFSLCRASHRVH